MSDLKLRQGIARLNHYVNTISEKKRRNLCLQYTRQALKDVGMVLPWNAYPKNLAKEAGYDLVLNPAAWGWQRVKPPLPRYTLDFYDGIAKLKDGRIAGHVGIVDRKEGIIYSAVPYKLTQTFQKARFASFVPLTAVPHNLLVMPSLILPDEQQLPSSDAENLPEEEYVDWATADPDFLAEAEVISQLLGPQTPEELELYNQVVEVEIEDTQ